MTPAPRSTAATRGRRHLRWPRPPRLLRLWPVLALSLGAGCALMPEIELQPFTTDGCSMFPDRSRTQGKDWSCCCVAHDLAYWRGGSWAERVLADEALRQCVIERTGDRPLADLMHAGVRAGGTPHLPTSFRWAYGWGRTGRTYEPLTEEERERADELQAQSAAARGAQCAAPAPVTAASRAAASAP